MREESGERRETKSRQVERKNHLGHLAAEPVYVKIRESQGTGNRRSTTKSGQKKKGKKPGKKRKKRHKQRITSTSSIKVQKITREGKSTEINPQKQNAMKKTC